MPTGYTLEIGEKDVSFKEFALRCARAFGACAEQRDAPMDELPKKRVYKSDGYYERILAKELDVSEKAFQKQKEEDIEHAKNKIARMKDLRVKYNKMLQEVSNWVIPSPDHYALKQFMIEQLSSSINWDCNTHYHETELENLQRISYEEWKNKQIEDYKSTISRAKEEIQKEKDRVDKANDWIEKLYASL